MQKNNKKKNVIPAAKKEIEKRKGSEKAKNDDVKVESKLPADNNHESMAKKVNEEVIGKDAHDDSKMDAAKAKADVVKEQAKVKMEEAKVKANEYKDKAKAKYEEKKKEWDDSEYSSILSKDNMFSIDGIKKIVSGDIDLKKNFPAIMVGVVGVMFVLLLVSTFISFSVSWATIRFIMLWGGIGVVANAFLNSGLEKSEKSDS